MNFNWKFKRFFEILPGLITWIILILPIVLSIYAPAVLAVLMIFFLVFWLTKAFIMSYRLILGYVNYKKDISLDWQKKLEHDFAGRWQEIYHLVIVPEYKEDTSLLESSIKSVIDSTFPKKNVIYVLATEERDKENALKQGEYLSKKFSRDIGCFKVIMHPKDIPGEVVGKGGNITFAAKKIVKYIESKNISFEKVVVTTMDADHVMDRQYLSCLTYKYLDDPDPVHKSFQPLPMFFNNIWDVPMINRLIAMGSSFWQMIVATRPSRLRNFSAHAQSLAALVKTDFWSVKTIVEDGHQFWRSYYKFNGRYEVVPLYIPIYQDAVLANGFLDTMKEQYLQKKRWAWGVSDIPYVMFHTFFNKKIHLVDRWANALILWESHISWGTTSLILATSSWLPLLLNPSFRFTVLAFNFRIIYTRLLLVAWIGMIITLIISTLLAPNYRGKKPVSRIILDWLFTPLILPISNILFSSFPALESQTRLMFGKYLENFRVTVKSARRSNVMEGGNANQLLAKK